MCCPKWFMRMGTPVRFHRIDRNQVTGPNNVCGALARDIAIGKKLKNASDILRCCTVLSFC